MELQLKANAINPPKDRYKVNCPLAYVKSSNTFFDYENERLFISWAMWRSQTEAETGIEPIESGTYVWEKEAKESVWRVVTPAVYAENGVDIVTPEVKVRVTPRFGAFSTVLNVVTNVEGTDFGALGASWILLFEKWSEFEVIY